MRKLLLVIFLITGISYSGIAQIDTNLVVYSWKLDQSLANRLRVDVDTLLDNFQQYNPALKKFTGIQTLGNFGQPAISIVYPEREESEFLMVNNFYPFMKRFQNTDYFNVRKPFTRISYIKGGGSQSKEEMFNAFHTQNITKNLNVGLQYTTIGSLGHYKFQKIKNNSFNLFSTLNTRSYSYHFSVNYNKIEADENGGVLNDSLITDTTFNFSKDIPTLFGGLESSTRHNPDVQNEIKNFNILAVQEYSFRNLSSNDSTNKAKTRKIFYPKLVYIFNINRTSRLFSDKKPSVGFDNGLYNNIYVNNTLTHDSTVNWKIANSARLQFQGKKNNHYFIDYSFELMKYSMSVLPDALADTLDIPFISEPYTTYKVINEKKIHSSYFSTGFSKIFAGRLDVNFYGRYYLSGYYSGDFVLSGDLKMNFGKLDKPVSFYAMAESRLKTPDYFQSRYISNNFIWSENFSKTTSNHLSTNFSISSKKFDINADYYLFSGLIFLNNNALPSQYNNALSVLALSVSKQFEFWKITSINKLVYQKSENEKILGLPELTYYNSTYLKHMFNFKSTGGKLIVMPGFDLKYNTKYYADAYMPALASFHRQTEKKLGNYPYLDVFLNVQLKRFRFFVKVEHLNKGWFKELFNNDYFSVLHYPRNGRDLKFGLSWTFYD